MIAIRNLQKIVGDTTIMHIASLQVESGQIAAVVGSADSGLHTLFQLVIGQLQATSGEITLNERTPDEKAAYVASLGVLFQQDTLYPHMSVEANLRFAAKLYHLDKQSIESTLSAIGLNDQAKQRAQKLPSGLMRRLALGRALLHDPQVLILFDPFARCDETTITLITNLLQQQRDLEKAILILSPSSDHLDFCDRVFALRHGELSPLSDTEAGMSVTTQTPFRIPVRMDGKVALINPVDVLYIAVEDGQVTLYTDDEHFALQFNLAELEARLSQSGFFRAHRGYLVNLQRVKDIISYTRDSFNLRLDDTAETQIPLSKNAANQLRKLFDY